MRSAFLIFLAVALVSFQPVGGQDFGGDRGTPPPPLHLKVLMIGNSYTAQTNDLFQQFVRSDPNASMTISLATQAGWGTADHYASRLLTVYDGQTQSLLDKLRQEDWDVVIVQEQSTLPSEAFLDIPGTRTLLQGGWADLSALIQAEAPNALIRPYQTWPRAWGNSYLQAYFQDDPVQMHLATMRVYGLIASVIGGEVIPVGSAFTWSMVQAPAISLHSGDGSHPSSHGRYLAGATLYSFVFNRSPYQSGYSAGGDPATEAWLLHVADHIWQVR